MTFRFAWQELFSVALVELEPQELRRKIELARNAIEQRFKELQSSEESSEERMALMDALNSLRFLERESRKPPL